MSPSDYPAALDTTGTTFPVRGPGETTLGRHSADHNNLADAIMKIEGELGVEPSSAYATVGARLDAASRVDALANRGSAASYPGSRFFAVDQLAEYISDGTKWIRTSAAAGETVIHNGLTLPTNLVRQSGATIPRTGIYADLFETQTRKAVGTGNSGQAVLTITGGTGEGLGLGMKVEGAGVPANATIAALTSTTITLSVNLTTTGGRDVRIFPHGNGDGSTTFTLPDIKGRTFVGRDNMGGSQTGDVTRQTGGVLGAVGGEMSHQLVQGAMPPHDHLGVTSGAGAHTHVGSSNGAGNNDGYTMGATAAFTALYVPDHGHTMNNHNHSASASTSIAADNGYSGAAVGNGVQRANASHGHSASTSVSIGGMETVYGSGYGSVFGAGNLGIAHSQNNHHHIISLNTVGNHQHLVYRSGSGSGTVNVAKGDAHNNMQPHMVTDVCLRL